MTRVSSDTGTDRPAEREAHAATVRAIVVSVLALLPRGRLRATALAVLARVGIDLELVIHPSPVMDVGLYDGEAPPRPCIFVSAALAPRSKAMRRAALRGVVAHVARRDIPGTGNIAALVDDALAELERRVGLPAAPAPRERARWQELRAHALNPVGLISGEIARLRAVGENGKADALETRASSASRGEHVRWSGKANVAGPSTGVRRAVRARSTRKTARAA